MTAYAPSAPSKIGRTQPMASLRPAALQPHERPEIDIVAIGNVTLSLYISGLFQNLGWTTASAATCAAGEALLRPGGTAVVICEETLPDGTWLDIAGLLETVPDPPALIVVGDIRALEHEVTAQGGFDVLASPLRESEVMWSVASAWHAWMQRGEEGGASCDGI
ncbi:MAG: hypothetical protein IT163_16605 [Bryobacterales bacterium]|nr:hypothetical protein [Bryobacterales bacterium]